MANYQSIGHPTLSNNLIQHLSFFPSPRSDGMSRTGVFITTMAEVERVKVQGEVDIFQTVKAARSERPHIVSTPVSNGAGGGGLWCVVGVGREEWQWTTQMILSTSRVLVLMMRWHF